MSQENSPYDRPFGGSVAKRALHKHDLTRDGIIPLLTRWGAAPESIPVLRAGCGDGGLAVAMVESGTECCSMDLRPERIACDSRLAAEHGVTVHLLADDILEMASFAQTCDIVVLSEVVEHLGSTANVSAVLLLPGMEATGSGCSIQPRSSY